MEGHANLLKIGHTSSLLGLISGLGEDGEENSRHDGQGGQEHKGGSYHYHDYDHCVGSARCGDCGSRSRRDGGRRRCRGHRGRGSSGSFPEDLTGPKPRLIPAQFDVIIIHNPPIAAAELDRLQVIRPVDLPLAAHPPTNIHPTIRAGLPRLGQRRITSGAF